MMKKIIFLISAFIFLPNISFAQESISPVVYFHVPQTEIAPNSEFYVTVFLDSQNPVNAVQIAVEFTPDTLEFVGHNDANSIISVWQERPSLLSEGLIGFTGGTFDGFSGEKGEIMKLRFRAKSEGVGGLGLRGSNLYLADGQGTEVATAPFFMRLNIKKGAELLSVGSVADKTPPKLNAFLSSDPEVKGTMLVLETEDDESGVSKVLVRYFKNFKWTPWQEHANSAAILAGTWFLEVKAVNGEGEENSKLIFSRGAKITGWTLLFLILIFLSYIWYNKR